MQRLRANSPVVARALPSGPHRHNRTAKSAKVTATNIETNVATSVETAGAGVYLLPGLTPGKYRIEASVTGFKTYRLQEPVVVFTATTSSLDIHMEVGEITHDPGSFGKAFGTSTDPRHVQIMLKYHF